MAIKLRAAAVPSLLTHWRGLWGGLITAAATGPAYGSGYGYLAYSYGLRPRVYYGPTVMRAPSITHPAISADVADTMDRYFGPPRDLCRQRGTRSLVPGAPGGGRRSYRCVGFHASGIAAQYCRARAQRPQVAQCLAVRSASSSRERNFSVNASRFSSSHFAIATSSPRMRWQTALVSGSPQASAAAIKTL